MPCTGIDPKNVTRSAMRFELERRLRRIEECLTDASGLAPHSRQWLPCRDRKRYG